MRKEYLDIMERVLSAYAPERIASFTEEVRQNGLTEQGFPRLGSNIGILMANGRRWDLKDAFIDIMELCCEQMPRKKANNDFSVREVCCCIMALEQSGAFDKSHTDRWKAWLGSFDPWKCYNCIAPSPDTPVGNWAMFAAVSEFVRGLCCGQDTLEFVDWELSSQLLSFDENGMYLEPGCPMVYDLIPRQLMSFLLSMGYEGKHREKIEELLDRSADITLDMQSVTGELPFGGRSNQTLFTEAALCGYCELEARRFAQKGDFSRAERFYAAADLSAECLRGYLSLSPLSHVKNRYPADDMMGCEDYGYFNKYMVTVASNLYMGAMKSRERETVCRGAALEKGSVVRTLEPFHKTFLKGGGYQLEIDSRADMHYDANGLGRVHRAGCHGSVCLSVPFPPHPRYYTPGENPGAMSLGCYVETAGGLLLGAEDYARHSFVRGSCGEHCAEALFLVELPGDIRVMCRYFVGENGVDISLSGNENLGFTLPVFLYDGKDHTVIRKDDSGITVCYGGSLCRFGFSDENPEELGVYFNRNGQYLVYKLKTDKLHIDIFPED